MAQDTRTKAALTQLAGGTVGPDLEALLGPGRVNIVIDGQTAREPQGQLLFSFAVNLLARLHPVVQQLTVVLAHDAPLHPDLPRWSAPSLAAHLTRLLSCLKPPLAWRVTDRSDASAGVSLVVGAQAEGAGERIFVGSRGWIAFISPSEAVPTDGPSNPVGAYAAACFGVAEVWKRLLVPHRHIFGAMPIVPATRTLMFSTLTYMPDAAAQPNPELPASIDLGTLTMVGVGAGGGAAAFTLASVRDVSGDLTVIEPDPVDDTNLNRYVFADSDDEGHSKAGVVEGFLDRFERLTVKAYPEAFSKVASLLPRESFRQVIAAVHSRAARREIQLETPEVLWDAAAAEDGEFRVWRLIFGITECMYCKHPLGDKDPEVEKSRQLAALLGLSPALWLQRIKDNEPFSQEEVASIGLHLAGQAINFAIPLPGQPFGDWEAAQCGKLFLPDADEAVPIPFAPVMAGVLLAGEVIKERHFPAHVLDSYYWNTLLGHFVTHNRPRRRGPRLNCQCCGDHVYQQQYRRRWREA